MIHHSSHSWGDTNTYKHIFNSSSITPEAFFYSPKFCLSSLGCSSYCPFHLTQAYLLICAFPLVIWMNSRYWVCLGTWRAKECPYSLVTYSAQSKRAEIRMALRLFHAWDGIGPHICISVKWTEITLAYRCRWWDWNRWHNIYPDQKDSVHWPSNCAHKTNNIDSLKLGKHTRKWMLLHILH